MNFSESFSFFTSKNAVNLDNRYNNGHLKCAGCGTLVGRKTTEDAVAFFFWDKVKTIID